MALQLENAQIRVCFSQEDGRLLCLEDKRRGFTHLQGGAKAFRLFDARREETTGKYRFAFCQQAEKIEFTWQGESETVKAEASLLEDGIAFRAAMYPEHRACASAALEYPILGGMADQREQTFLAHGWTTGVLIQHPASALPETGALRFTPYPESFSGASLQLMTLYHCGQAGLYLAAHDGEGHQKWLNAYTEKGALVLSHMFGMEDMRPGAPAEMTWDFVVRLTPGTGWEDAADMYRDFALTQPWCQRGPLHQRTDCASWLHEEVGYCTFGINAGHDRSRWLKRYRADIGQKGFHVLGPDWTNQPQTFGWGVPGGMEDWLPSRFDPHTIQAIRDNGDRFAPFEFDFLVDLHQHQQEELKQNLQNFPENPMSHDGYTFHMLCPCEPFTKDFHRERDVRLLQESGMDAIYYDISANNLIKLCTRQDHHHTPGGGREINEGYREIYRDTSEGLQQAAGHPVPMGTEQMCEVFLDRLDFYQARAWGQPCSTLETWPIRQAIRTGQARMIPLFDYVYHEWGVVRMDGWGKLVEETGELFYDTVAKTYLWGGLYEINHEYSPMEELDGVENSAQEHYFRFDPQHCAYSPKRAAWVGKLAAARLGAAKPFWAYGRMVRAPHMEIPMTKMCWYHYNHDQHNDTYKDHGEYEVPSLRTSAYEAPDGRVAWFAVACGTEDVNAKLPVGGLAARYPGRKAALYRLDAGQPVLVADFGRLSTGQDQDVDFTFASRELYMLEIMPE